MMDSTQRTRGCAVGPLLAAAFVLAIAACGDVAAPNSPMDTPQKGLLMQLKEGPVHGTLEHGTRSFIGVPYAAPPIGELRWKPPQPVSAWREPLEASGPGVACPQPAQPDAISITQSEDCLTLNVFAPAEAPEALVPVIVWLHGGGNTVGSANTMITSDPVLGHVPPSRALYDGAAYRENTEREVVVVTVNYRLGQLGFLSHPELSAEGRGASGNYGLMDQQAALAWVHDHIAAFGGDPTRVTLVGQGAGATDVCYHLLATDSRSLFQAAVLQSGSCGSQHEPPLPEAEKHGVDVAAALGCSGQNGQTAVACLRALPTSTLVEDVDAEELVRRELDAQVVIDGHVLQRSAAAALSSSDFAKVPLIIGNDDRCSRTECAPAEAERDAKLFVCPARALARTVSSVTPVFVYSLTRSAAFAPSPEQWTNIASGSEQLWLWNIWPRLSPYSADDGVLSLQMRGYWNQLVEGDVNLDVSMQRWTRPHWPAYNVAQEAELTLDLTIESVEHHRTHCD